MSRFQPQSRRRFIKQTGLATGLLAVSSAIPSPLLVKLGAQPEPVPSVTDPRIKELAQRALDVATAAGASYADVRLSHERIRKFGFVFGTDETETLNVGVRVLSGGYWGFTSGAIWSFDEMSRLAKNAVHIAQLNKTGQQQSVELAKVDVVRDGHWETPVKIDPFSVDPNEVSDFIDGLRQKAALNPFTPVQNPNTFARFFRQDRAFASTTGTYCTQRIFVTDGGCFFSTEDRGYVSVDQLTPAGAGWEYFRERPIFDMLDVLLQEIASDAALPWKPIEVGRYTTVVDAPSMVNVASATLGVATELDRAMGYEANAGGTSYLQDPIVMVNTLQLGPSALNVTADRTMSQGAATVAWDDEGVKAQAWPLIVGGRLVDMQTTRESAMWLRDASRRSSHDLQSRGCASAATAADPQLTQTSNLTLHSSLNDNASFDTMVKEIGQGIAFKNMRFNMDFQQGSGLGLGWGFEVKNGKRTAKLSGAGVSFRSTELWKSLQHVGSSAFARQMGVVLKKGEPPQSSLHTVSAPPAVFAGVTVVDIRRKA